MYKITQTIKNLIPITKGLINGLASSIYNKFHPDILPRPIPLPDTEKVIESIRNNFDKLDFPRGTPIEVQNTIRCMIDNEVCARTRYELSLYAREKGVIPFFRELYSDIKDHSPLIGFLEDVINPFSGCKAMYRVLFASSLAISVALPSLICTQVKMLGDVFCQFANEDSKEKCKEHSYDLSYWSYVGTLGVSGGIVLATIHYIAD